MWGETGRGDGVKKRLRGVKGGQRTRLRGGRAGEEIRKEGRMSERVASCGSLYDSTNLLLQYCNTGELLLISPQHTQQNTKADFESCFDGSLKCVSKCIR